MLCNKKHAQKVCTAEMRMLRWMLVNMPKVRIGNKCNHKKVGIASMEDSRGRIIGDGLDVQGRPSRHQL